MRALCLTAVLATVLLASGSPAIAAEAFETRGKIDDVTVYRDQALVLREVTIDRDAGLQEIVVTDLPDRIVPESLYAESADGVEVRSVRYRIRPVMQDVRAEVRKLDEEIQGVSKELETNQRYRQLNDEQKSYLNKLEQFTAPTANVELTKGVLNADTLKELTSMMFSERRKLAESELKLADERAKLQEKLQLLTRNREVLTGGSAKTMREAVVFAQIKHRGGKMRVGYLVTSASWTPSYNVRSDKDRKKVTVEYNAAIQQMSGEDWNDVAMTLSTATPSLVAEAPALDPLVITLASVSAAAHGGAGGNYAEMKKGLEDRQRQLEGLRANSKSPGSGVFGAPQSGPAPDGSYGVFDEAGAVDYDTALNELANTSQVLDLVNREQIRREQKPQPKQEGVSVSYRLPQRNSLPSRSDRQLIQIASNPMKADFYKAAIPVLTSYVYEQAEVTNDSGRVLLPGPFSAYVAGQFVGRGDLPLVAVGEGFAVGFGIDSSLRASRELATKTESIQGGNRLVDLSYVLKVENFGNEPAEVRLLDRLPTAKENDIKLTLVSTEKKLSEDPAYPPERKKGLLRWEVKVPPQAIGPKAETVEYKLQMEYDKQLSIAGLPIRK